MSSSYFLYAEDDADDVGVLKEFMLQQSSPKEIVCVANGFEILEYLQQIKKDESYPCLIILDFHLPRLNGMDTLVLLKTDDLYRLIPVVVFSSKLSSAEEEKCRSLGADLLMKPSRYAKWSNVLQFLYTYVDE